MFHGHSAEVAIRATLYLAGRPPGELSPVRDIAKATKLPRPYLSKVVQRLAQAGLVRTFRGPGGGIELGKPPDAITLWNLLCATDAAAGVKRCALGIGTCSPSNPCPLHEKWLPIRREFQKLLESTTLAALLREVAETRTQSQETVTGLSASRPAQDGSQERTRQ